MKYVEVLFLNKKQLRKLNRKERQDYLETETRYIRFQKPLMTGMIKHIENAHEFNKFQHKLDEDYLIETYEKVINTNYSKIKKKEKKEDKIPVVRETPVVREERIVETNNGMKNFLSEHNKSSISNYCYDLYCNENCRSSCNSWLWSLSFRICDVFCGSI